MTLIRALIATTFTLALLATAGALLLGGDTLGRLGGITLLAAAVAMVLYVIAILNERYDFTGARAPLR